MNVHHWGVVGAGSHLAQGLNVLEDQVDVSFDVVHGAYGKAGLFVHGAKGAAVPRAVTGHAYQKAVCLARWPYRPLFKSLVRVSCFILHDF